MPWRDLFQVCLGFYVVWADRLARSVNSSIERVGTIKKDHQKPVPGITDLHSWQSRLVENCDSS